MKNFKEKSLKVSNGITLIALVITIIVLLILAGISISMLSGDNSILQKATTAKENTESSQIQERINLAYHSSLVDGQGKVTEPSLESELKKEFNKDTLGENWLDKTSTEGKWKITIDDVSLDVPAGTDETPILVDESTKLYDVLKDKTAQEIFTGVTVDGIDTIYVGFSGNDIYIEYNNQDYKVSFSSGYISVLAINQANNLIKFYISNGGTQINSFKAIEGMTFGGWVNSFGSSQFTLSGWGGGNIVEKLPANSEVVIRDPEPSDDCHPQYGWCMEGTTIKANHTYFYDHM